MIIQVEAFMRYIVFVLAVVLTLSGCGGGGNIDRLGYQESGLSVIGNFSVDGDEFPAELTLAAPKYDESGRMLAREGKLIFGEGSVIEGVGFEFSAGEFYIFSDGLKIPLEDEVVVGRLSRVISLFCISDESYHSSERGSVGGVSTETALYTDGESRAEVVLDLSTLLPISISATADGRSLSVDIDEIRRE